jgi:hypothetical protein
MGKKNVSKRDIFAELMEGVNAMKQSRERKATLHTHKLPKPAVEKAPRR